MRTPERTGGFSPQRSVDMAAQSPSPSPSPSPSSSIGELLGEISEDMSTLMRQELDLAKAELRQEAGKAGKAAGMLGGAALAGYMVLLFLSLALWWGLSNVMDQGWAALIVAAVWVVIGAILYAVGRSRMREMRGLPQTTATVKEMPETLKGHPTPAERKQT